MVRGDVLQIVIFSVLFALAVSAIGEKGKPIVRAMESLAQIMFKFTNYVMLFAPIGVGAAMAHTIGTQGLGCPGESRQIDRLTLSGSRHFHFASLWVGDLDRADSVAAIRQGCARARDACIRDYKQRIGVAKGDGIDGAFGVPPHIVGFVMPTGYSFNLDGSTLYLALASVFVAQAAETTMGWHMGFGQQLVMVLTLILTSKGVAAVPRASLVILLATVNSFLPVGLGPIGVAVIFGVDELMDMGRTCVNVIGNCLATVVVARWEGEFDDARARVFGTSAEAEMDLKAGNVAFADAATQGD